MRCLLLVAALLCASSLVLAKDACNGQDYGTAGQFAFYVFEQSVPAEFCAGHSSEPGCENPTPYQQANLTIHGLWPNYDKAQGSHEWPQCCQSTYGTALSYDTYTQLSSSLQTYWPSEQNPQPTSGDIDDSLWSHEWSKHGTCSGLNQVAYFQAGMHVAQMAGTPAPIANNIGGTVQLSDLYAAYPNASSCASGNGACTVGFTCDKKNGQEYLSGVTTCWDQQLNMIQCPSEVLSKHCKGPQISIRGFNSKKAVAKPQPVSEDSCKGKDYGTAGDFDFFVFSQSVPAEFCFSHSSEPGCTNPTAYQQANLTIHGLWPNYQKARGEHDWPQCCQSTYGTDFDYATYTTLSHDLQTYWPNEQQPQPSKSDISSSLWSHEWNKHGTCSGSNQVAYFTAGMQVQNTIGTPDVIAKNIGGTAQLSDMYAAYLGQGNTCNSGDDCKVGFFCTGSDTEYLSEVETCWDKGLNQVVCPAAVFSSGQLCQGPTITISSFSQKKRVAFA